MQTIKPIDENMARLGSALKNARVTCHLSLDDAAGMLHIMPNELFIYERGAQPIPIDILYRLFIMGYKMIEVRVINHRYEAQRNAFRQIKRAIAETQ